jgi:hypothetical protein
VLIQGGLGEASAFGQNKFAEFGTLQPVAGAIVLNNYGLLALV